MELSKALVFKLIKEGQLGIVLKYLFDVTKLKIKRLYTINSRDKIKVELTQDANEIPGGQVIRAITLKHITNPENNGVEISEFVATDLKVQPKTIKTGNTSIEFKESKRDLIYLLKPKMNPLGAFITSNSTFLPPGKIIHKLVKSLRPPKP